MAAPYPKIKKHEDDYSWNDDSVNPWESICSHVEDIKKIDNFVPLNIILRQLHPNLCIDIEALAIMEDITYFLLGLLVNTLQLKPKKK